MESQLTKNIYKKMMEDLGCYMKIEEGHKMKCLDLYAGESYVNDFQLECLDYKSMDTLPSYERNDRNINIDFQGEPTNIPSDSNTYDIIFGPGARLFYGDQHLSLPEVERVLKPGGLLIIALSKFWYFKELNQILVATRSCFNYIRSIEIGYIITESKIDSAKYFVFYRYKG